MRTIKKILIFILFFGVFFIFCENVLADWWIYTPQYNVTGEFEENNNLNDAINDYNSRNGTNEDYHIVSKPNDIRCEYNIDNFKYKDDKEVDLKVRIYKTREGKTAIVYGAAEEMQSLGRVEFVNGLEGDERFKLCNSEDCVCPILYIGWHDLVDDAIEENDVVFGFGSNNMKNNKLEYGSNDTALRYDAESTNFNFREVKPALKNGAQMCLGLRDDFTKLENDKAILDSNSLTSKGDADATIDFFDAKIASVSTGIDALEAYTVPETFASEEEKNSVEAEIDALINPLIAELQSLRTINEELNDNLDNMQGGYTTRDGVGTGALRCDSVTEKYVEILDPVEQKKAKLEAYKQQIEALGARLNQLQTKYEGLCEESFAELRQEMAETEATLALIQTLTGGISNPEIILPLDSEVVCGILDEGLVAVITTILDIVRIVIPILLIVLITIDFGQAVISQDQDMIKKATSKVVKRIIAAIALFFIPLLVSRLLQMEGIKQYTSSSQECSELDFIFGNDD